MAKYRKKPVEVEAYQWTADIKQDEYPDWSKEAYKRGDIKILCAGTPACRMVIKTLEGEVTAKPGNYIIRGVAGEIYPCKSEIFEATYDLIN